MLGVQSFFYIKIRNGIFDMSIKTTQYILICPNCKSKNNILIHLTDDLPKSGNLMICAECKGIGKFKNDHEVVKLTPEEMIDIHLDGTIDEILDSFKTAGTG
jgi:hypothetical protein